MGLKFMRENFFNKVDNYKTYFVVVMYYLSVIGLALKDRQSVQEYSKVATDALLRERQGIA